MTMIELRLFGAFRQWEDGRPVMQLEIDENATAQDVKNLLYSHFSDRNLIEESVIADEKMVLQAGDLIGERRNLAILPPVCGG